MAESLFKQFLKNANIDWTTGCSDEIYISEIKDPILRQELLKQPNQWGRRENWTKVGLDYRALKDGNKIIGYQALGFKKAVNLKISSKIREYFKGKLCEDNYGTVGEIDHCNGVKNDPEVFDFETQRPEQFQFISRDYNLFRRGICIKCQKTRKRPKGTDYGYANDYYYGGEELDIKNPNCCVGCPHFSLKLTRKYMNRKIGTFTIPDAYFSKADHTIDYHNNLEHNDNESKIEKEPLNLFNFENFTE